MFKFSIGNGIGVRFGRNTLLFDPNVSDFISFISHAHADHSPFGFVTKPYCTPETYELIRLRDPYFEANVVEENKKIKFDDFSVILLSAGHVLGSVQVYVEADGGSIVYSGDFKLAKSFTCKPIRIKEADILVMESTYGRSEYSFPKIEDLRKNIIQWVTDQLKNKFFVEIGAYQIGKSQEAIKILNESGIIPNVSETIRRYSEIYKRFGIYLKFLEPNENSNILVKPIHLLRERNNVKTCALTGWSIENNKGMERPRPYFGFPLSDHADFNDILEYVRLVNPKKVYCVHGYTHELAKVIKKKLKIPAKPLDSPIDLLQQKLLTDF